MVLSSFAARIALRRKDSVLNKPLGRSGQSREGDIHRGEAYGVAIISDCALMSDTADTSNVPRQDLRALWGIECGGW
jgi:hypothetical protein